jgi:hypothetical protein
MGDAILPDLTAESGRVVIGAVETGKESVRLQLLHKPIVRDWGVPVNT